MTINHYLVTNEYLLKFENVAWGNGCGLETRTTRSQNFLSQKPTAIAALDKVTVHPTHQIIIVAYLWMRAHMPPDMVR